MSNRTIKFVVIHCSDSPNARNFTVKDVDQWHRERGFHRTPEWVAKFNPDLLAIGYHFFIDRTGAVFTGRHIDEVGAHVEGENHDSVGICLCGKDIFTDSQTEALRRQVVSLLQVYPAAEVCGHYEFPSAKKQGKTCPNFNARQWWEDVKKKSTPEPDEPDIVPEMKKENLIVMLFSKLFDFIVGKL